MFFQGFEDWLCQDTSWQKSSYRFNVKTIVFELIVEGLHLCLTVSDILCYLCMKQSINSCNSMLAALRETDSTM